MGFLPSRVDSFVGEMCIDPYMHSMDRYLVNTNHVPGFVQGLEEARLHGTQPICLLVDHPLRPRDVSTVIVIQCDQRYNDGAMDPCTPAPFTGSPTPLWSALPLSNCCSRCWADSGGYHRETKSTCLCEHIGGLAMSAGTRGGFLGCVCVCEE